MWTPEERALVGDLGCGQALSDEQYDLVEPPIPPPKPGGRPRTTDVRRVLDGLFYLVRTPAASGGICRRPRRSRRGGPSTGTFVSSSPRACGRPCAITS